MAPLHQNLSRGQNVRRWFDAYCAERRHMEAVWDLVKQPIKFPAPPRRRREPDLPKAA